MATGEKKINIFTNRFLSKEDLDGRLLQYFNRQQEETLAALVGNASGILETSGIDIQSDGAANLIKLNIGSGSTRRLVTGDGKVLTLTGEVQYETEGIQFENEAGETYDVAYRFNEIEKDASVNPRKGIPEYLSIEDSIGEVGNPDSVDYTEGPKKVTININSLTETGVDHSGRQVRVWLTTAQSAIDTEAFYTGTSVYSNPNNTVEINAVDSKILGQDVSASEASEVVTDYKVQVVGPTIKKNTSLSSNNDYAFIGTITGDATTPTYDMSAQKLVFFQSLQKAYDASGNGAGREITVSEIFKPVTINVHPGQDLAPDTRPGLRATDNQGDSFWSIEQFGRIADVPRFKDDFLQHEDGWVAKDDAPIEYDITINNSGDAFIIPGNLNEVGEPIFADASGLLEVKSGTTASDNILISTGYQRVKGRRPCIYGRFAVSEITSQTIKFVCRPVNGLSTYEFGFKIVNADLKGFVDNNSTVTETSTLDTIIKDNIYEFMAVLVDNDTIAFWMDNLSSPELISTQIDFDTISDDYRDWAMMLDVNTDSGGVEHKVYLDYWEFWTLGRIKSPLST